ncbi:hypothetical protein ACFQ0O_21090 [Saccharopolyspora spinosporotrichia]
MQEDRQQLRTRQPLAAEHTGQRAARQDLAARGGALLQLAVGQVRALLEPAQQRDELVGVARLVRGDLVFHDRYPRPPGTARHRPFEE